METRNIFLDTSIFIGQNYNYRSTVFDKFRRLATSEQARVFVTDITVREIEAHIEVDVSKAIHASAKFKKDARVLRNIGSTPFNELFQEIDETVAIRTLKDQLSTFINDVDATVLSTSEASIESVFDKYFGKIAPFGEGKKKAEFPDAFAIEALEVWCEENEEKIYVASTDPDLTSHCNASDNLISLNKLAEFISLIEFHDEVLAPTVGTLLETNRELIEEAVGESFCDQGFWIDDQDGDVNEVTINELEVYEILLLEVDRNSAVVQVDVKTNFSADLTYDDLDTASYDSEDKVLIPWRTIDKTVDQDVEYTATVHVSHDVNNPEYFNVDRVDINTERDFGFSVTSDDEWPYK